MAEINPLRFGVTGNNYLPNETKEKLPAKSDEQTQKPQEDHKQVSSGDVLSYMAGFGKDLVPAKTTRTYNVSKYVTPEQEARIASSMANFEAGFDDAYAAAIAEFPEISEEAASEIALAYVNSSN